MGSPRIFRHSGLLGTHVDIRISGRLAADADVLDSVVVAEVERLESIFSVYRPDSELARWRRGEELDLSPEFVSLMTLTLAWQAQSHGRFNPMTGALTDLWRRAEADGTPPSSASLASIVASLTGPKFEIVDGVPVRCGDCTHLDLNAIAKGFIVDAALDAALKAASNAALDAALDAAPNAAPNAVLDSGVTTRNASPTSAEPGWIALNAGGDVAHRGVGELTIGIENPHRPYDNEPPLTRASIENCALATSGVARRGFRVNDTWFGHVLDPTTGQPVDHIASISVVAPTAVLADVMTTSAGVLEPADAIAFVEGFDGFEAFIVDKQRTHWATSGWAALERR